MIVDNYDKFVEAVKKIVTTPTNVSCVSEVRDDRVVLTLDDQEIVVTKQDKARWSVHVQKGRGGMFICSGVPVRLAISQLLSYVVGEKVRQQFVDLEFEDE